ncbi:hypothetical protein RyT2_10590 [Pseudolactococcus yaeyamensis]
MSDKQTQLDVLIEEMFENESAKVTDVEKKEFGHGKVIIIVIAVMMSVVVLLSFLYKIL